MLTIAILMTVFASILLIMTIYACLDDADIYGYDFRMVLTCIAIVGVYGFMITGTWLLYSGLPK